jgi:hypothetical protein
MAVIAIKCRTHLDRRCELRRFRRSRIERTAIRNEVILG